MTTDSSSTIMGSEYPIYCPICGDDGDNSIASSVSGGLSRANIFQIFLKVFRTKWRGKSFSFCEGCRYKVILISELERDLQALQKKLKEQESELQLKMQGSEVMFESKKLYTRDKRYFKLRRQILGEQKVAPPAAQPADYLNGRKLPSELHVPIIREEDIKVEVEEAQEDLEANNMNLIVVLSRMNEQEEDRMEWNQDPYNSDSDSDYQPNEKDTAKFSSPPRQRASKRRSTRTRKSPKVEVESIFAEEETKEDGSEEGSPPKKVPKTSNRRLKKKSAAAAQAQEEKEKLAEANPNKKIITYRNCHLTQTSDDKFSCSRCDAILPNKSNILRTHVIKEHTNLFSCPHCFKCFGQASHLSRHVNDKHNKVPPHHECPICSRPFTRPEIIKNHLWTHYSEEDKAEALARGEKMPSRLNKEFQCDHDQCDRSYSSNLLLAQHVKKKHGGGEVPEKEKQLCGVCGTAVLNIKKHMKIKHTAYQDRKLECGICKRRFLQNGSLQLHRKQAHSTEKPFKCEVCKKEFKFLKNLTEHQLGHEEKKPFACHLCGLGFTRNYVLQRHIANLHEGKVRSDSKKGKKFEVENVEIKEDEEEEQPVFDIGKEIAERIKILVDN